MSLLRDRNQTFAPAPVQRTGAQVCSDSTPLDQFIDLKLKIHERLIRELDPDRLTKLDAQALR